MPPPRAPTIPQFARRLAIETPEHLVLELELAGVGSRIAAAARDAVLLSVVYMALGIGVATLQTRTGPPGPWSTLLAGPGGRSALLRSSGSVPLFHTPTPRPT